MAPTFWKTKHTLSLLLLPVSMLHRLISFLHPFITTKYRAGIPVICVGNVTVGGAGKTPVTLAITELLRSQGMNVAIASRGYKGNITSPTRVEKYMHTIHSVGDEPLLLAEIAPTYIAKYRPLAIQMAENNGADIVIMDDGLQNPSVVKDISLLVIDGKYGIGNGFIMPAGPLRETLASGIAKSDAVILIGNDDTGILQHPCLHRKKAIPVLRAEFKPHGNLPDKAVSYIAFAGIGNPDKFFDTLTGNGFNIIETISFPDHYNYSDSDITKLVHKAENCGAALITTEKDAVRLPTFARKKIYTLPVKIVWENDRQIRNIIMEKLKK